MVVNKREVNISGVIKGSFKVGMRQKRKNVNETKQLTLHWNPQNPNEWFFFDKCYPFSFIGINSVKLNYPGSSDPSRTNPAPRPHPSHSQPTFAVSTPLIIQHSKNQLCLMNLTCKFLRWPPLRVCKCQAAALERDSWPDLCMALGWPPAAGRGTWLGGTRSETWRSCHLRRTGVCEVSRCIPCCTPCPAPPARTAEMGDWKMGEERH